MELVYKPSWKSYYKDFIIMLLLLVCAGVMNYLKPEESWLGVMWICVLVVDVVLFLYVCVRRATMTLTLRDDPSDKSKQEVAFSTCNPLKPWSREFRHSIEIGLSNIMHIKVGQTMMQSMLNIGDIIITSSGTGGDEITAKNIPAPSSVRDTIQEHARKYTLS